MHALLIRDGAGNVKEWHRGHWKECVRMAGRLPAGGRDFHAIVNLLQPATEDDEYVTLDAVLSRGRHEGDSGCDLGNMPT